MWSVLDWLLERCRTRSQRIRALGGDPDLGTVGRYVKLRLLSQGDTSLVYVAAPADSLRREHLVALKILLLPKSTSSSLEWDQRQNQLRDFFREIHLLRKLNHPNLVRLVEVVEDVHVPFLAREYIDGQTLTQRMKARPGQLSEAEFRPLAKTLLEALAYAHENRVVHRGLQPDNVMMTADGVLKVTNFGLARPVDFHGRLVYGSPGYIPPEILSGSPGKPDPTHDQYAIGLILFELLAGRPANPGRDISEKLFCGLEHDLLDLRELRPDLGGLCDWVQRLMAREAFRRFPSLEVALEELSESTASLTPPAAPLKGGPSGPERNG